MNGELNIDLQSFVKRTYFALLYNSTFYNFLNENYIGALRQTGAPIIEVIKSNNVSVNVRSTAEIANALTHTTENASTPLRLKSFVQTPLFARPLRFKRLDLRHDFSTIGMYGG